MVAVGMAIAVSSFGIVRAEHVMPDKSKTYKCSSGTACVQGNSTGSSTWGVYGVGAIADGVHGVTSSINGNSGTSGTSTGTTGSAHGVYGRSSNGQGLYGTSSSNNGVGRSRVEFDYRIVAQPLDAKNDRLPIAPAMRRAKDTNPSR
jgi:hypothetical protein